MLWYFPDWSLLQCLAIVIGGVASGFINTLAGGGSFVTLPLLILLGISPLIANATNRLALAIQNATSATGYWVAGERDTTTILWLAFPGLLGSVGGAYIAVYLDPSVFRKLFAVLLALAVIPVVFRPQIFNNQPEEALKHKKPSPQLLIGFFFVGIYSGFLQVGIGVWSLLLLLLFGGFQVNHANAIKSQLLFLTTTIATIIFLMHDQIILFVSLLLAAGNATGAWLATRLVSKRKVPWIRWVVLFGALVACLKLLHLV